MGSVGMSGEAGVVDGGVGNFGVGGEARVIE